MLKKISLMGFIIGFILSISGCNNGGSDYKLLQTQQNISKNTVGAPQSIDYRILPHDRLRISVYSNPQLTTEAHKAGNISSDIQEGGMLVNADGNIFLPLIGQVKIAGLTQTQAKDRITEKFSTYLKIPLVYVEVLNKRLYVIGEVKKPGPIELDREKMNLLEALANAGDLTDNAVRDNIIVISQDALDNKMTMRSVDLTKFDHLSIANMMLKPNDIVYVQPNGWKEYKVTSDNLTAPFKTISEIAQPFMTIKFISQ